MSLKVFSLSLLSVVTFASMTAFAEPAVQPGETLESLSKAKLITTVNGQPGTIQQVLTDKNLQVVQDSAAPTQAAPTSQETDPAASTPAETPTQPSPQGAVDEQAAPVQE